MNLPDSYRKNIDFVKNWNYSALESLSDKGKGMVDDFKEDLDALFHSLNSSYCDKFVSTWKAMNEYGVSKVYRKNIEFYSLWEDVKNFPDPTKIFKDFEDNPTPLLELVKKGEGKLFVDRWKAFHDLHFPDKFRKDYDFINKWGDDAIEGIKVNGAGGYLNRMDDYYRDFIVSAGYEFISYYAVYTLMDEEINIYDLQSDVLIAGITAAKNKDNKAAQIWAAIGKSLDVDQCLEIFNNPANKEAILHQFFDAFIGLIGSPAAADLLRPIKYLIETLPGKGVLEKVITNMKKYCRSSDSCNRFMSFLIQKAYKTPMTVIDNLRLSEKWKNSISWLDEISSSTYKFLHKEEDGLLYIVKYESGDKGRALIFDFAIDEVLRFVTIIGDNEIDPRSPITQEKLNE